MEKYAVHGGVYIPQTWIENACSAVEEMRESRNIVLEVWDDGPELAMLDEMIGRK